METFEISQAISMRLYRLNRTMQYGNYLHAKAYFRGVSSLNRTMQYGNFSRHIFFFLFFECLNRTMQYGNPIVFSPSHRATTRFKSYYVVWKRKNIITDDEKEESLNRTMQYGNLWGACAQFIFLVKFKSYYVVWKPTVPFECPLYIIFV